jgi:hypothetical protein
MEAEASCKNFATNISAESLFKPLGELKKK